MNPISVDDEGGVEMELGKQIRKYRNEMSLSQDGLAERIFVSRQTISNWENDKSYPDVNSLLLLSQVFETSLDNLIKGDIDVMKKKIQKEDQKSFEKLSNVFGILLALVILSPVALIHYLGDVGIVIWVALTGITFYVAVKVEKKKKEFDIQTYREIIAFTQGTGLDHLGKAREEGKRLYQKILLALGAGLMTLIIAGMSAMLLK